MKARLLLSPLDAPISETEIKAPCRLSQVFPDAEVMEWFEDGGCVRLNGHVIPPEKWPLVTLKPHAGAVLDFIYVPQGKKTFALLASVALVALTAGIGTFGVPFLGTGFAAGTFGASAAAAAVGLAGSLAISAITAPPKSGNSSAEQRALSQAGVSGNTLTLLDTIPVIIGKIGASPPMLAPPYTVWDGDDMIAYASVGVQGRNLIENVKVNGVPISEYAGATVEVLEGSPGETKTLFASTVIEERDNITLSNFKTRVETDYSYILEDQAVPENSMSQWHYFKTSGGWDEVVFRLLFSSGIVFASTGTAGAVAFRLECRKIGDASWRRLPTIHIADQNKGLSPLRTEIRIARKKRPGGRQIVYAHDDYPVFFIGATTGAGQWFEYEADPYFRGTSTLTTPMVIMSGNTTSGVSITASSGNSSAWRVYDNDVSLDTYWSPAANSLPADLIIQLPTAHTIKSYRINSDDAGTVGNFYNNTPSTSPLSWEVYGSNNGTDYVALDDGPVDISAFPLATGLYGIQNPGAYTYYKFKFLTNNGAANQALRINYLVMFHQSAGGVMTRSFGSEDNQGANSVNPVDGIFTCLNCGIGKLGAEIYLDPGEWASGEYEFRVKRSWGFAYQNFNGEGMYSYAGASNASFFDYYLLSGKYRIYQFQGGYRSDCLVEAFQTISSDAPFDNTGVSVISVAIPNTAISSIYAEFTRYAPVWNGTIWSATEVPTKNPAALYRQILLGGANAMPVPGESIDEDGLADWYETCEANGYEANAILQGARVGEAKQLIATAGYASPRDAETYGVVEDRDTSADPVRYLITPLNSKDEGTTHDLPNLPDAIRAEFADETLSYAVNHTIVYRDGVDAATAKVFETINYAGFTDAAKVDTRALFDLKQSRMRQVRYSRRMGIEGFAIRRGMLVGLSDDVIDGGKAAGWIRAVTTDAGNIVSITLDNIMPWSASSDIELADDVEAITDILNPSLPMGVAIRIPGQDALLKQVSDISDSNVCTFSTPFPAAGSGITTDLLVVAGQWGNVVRRCKVISVVPQGFEERLVVLADEAPELFA